MSIVYFQDKFLPEDKVAIPLSDRGFLYGDALFTTIRVRNGHPECLAWHLERLQTQAELLKIALTTFDKTLVEELIRANSATTGTWRLKIIVTGGQGHALHLSSRVGNPLMFLAPYEPGQETAALCFYPEAIARPLAKFKTLSLLDQLWVKDYAVKMACDDAIVTNQEGYLLETAFANLFWRQGKFFYTPSRELPLLSGIALRLVKKAVEQLGMKMEEVLVKEIPTHSQLYLCNSLMGIRPVVRVEQRAYSRDEDFEQKLQQQFENSIF